MSLRTRREPISEKSRRRLWIFFGIDIAFILLTFVFGSLDLENPFIYGALLFCFTCGFCLCVVLFCINAYLNWYRFFGPVEADQTTEEGVQQVKADD
jgi:hypothetical protein